MRRAGPLLALLVCACVQQASLAAAQTVRGPIGGRIEVAVGASRIGAGSVGARDATLTAADGSRFRLFSTSSELASASGVELRLGARVAPVLDVEIVASYAVPRLTTSVTADAEAGAAATASESIGQITIGGAAVIYLPRRLGPRVVPFVAAGGGYIQQLHERQTLIQRGRMFHLGGGVKVPLASRAARQNRVKQIGVRVDAGALVRTAGVTVDDRAHVAPALAASLFVRF
jgi:hypothetical protein